MKSPWSIRDGVWTWTGFSSVEKVEHAVSIECSCNALQWLSWTWPLAKSNNKSMKKLVDFLQKLHNENGDELPVKTTWYKSTKLSRESYTSLREVSSWFGQSFPRSAPLSIARSQYAKKFSLSSDLPCLLLLCNPVPSLKQDNLWTQFRVEYFFKKEDREMCLQLGGGSDQKNWRLKLSAQEYKIVWKFGTIVTRASGWIENTIIFFLIPKLLH